MNLDTILKKPIVSEKATKATDKRNVYCFHVDLKSNKNQIKQAIESFYNVKVESCTTAIIPGKVKRTAKGVSKSSSWKKAYVKVSNDQTIKLFDGV
ncbi:MAG: 50S ribosomal protein L23 [Halobacteriovoraceae bacterium]|nr:50S ribosomal protein L23 [Halobacteriovoraceae bacterium]|tara:strand:+ start:511 stop:798 length:288 start_codon:yes stop_codon:yes gene_type:complete